MIASAFELLHSDKTILMIALESGFSNPESYTRAFKKIFGMTPSRFRIERPLMVRKQLNGLVEETDDEEGDNSDAREA